MLVVKIFIKLYQVITDWFLNNLGGSKVKWGDRKEVRNDSSPDL